MSVGDRIPVKRHRGEPGHTRDTRTHKGTQTTPVVASVVLTFTASQTNLTTIQTHQQHTPRTDGCEVRPSVCNVSCVSRLPPVSFYR